MFERFTDKARRAVVLAQEEARMLKHHEIEPEHLLIALTRDNGAAGDALAEAELSTTSAVEALTALVPVGETTPRGHLPFTVPARKVMEQALREALVLGHSYVGTDHLLLALLSVTDEDSVAVKVLSTFGIRPESLRRIVMGELPADPTGPFEFEVHVARDGDAVSLHLDADEAAAAAGDDGSVTAGRFTLGRGECFSIRDEFTLRDDLRYLDYANARTAAGTHGAEVCILTPISTEVTALAADGTEVVIGTGTHWAAVDVEARLMVLGCGSL